MSDYAKSQYIIVDTCVLLDDPNVITRIRKRGGTPFLTSTVLREVDFNKKGDEPINKNARHIFREMNVSPSARMNGLPCGRNLVEQDILTRFPFEGGEVFLIGRKKFRDDSNNDGKIIELAKDYNMLLLTRDGGMKVRAETEGVAAVLWQGQNGQGSIAQPSNARSGKKVQSKSSRTHAHVAPFAVASSPMAEKDRELSVSHLPKEGDQIILGSGVKVRLGAEISAGGEGRIYHTGNPNVVCKVYHRTHITALRQRKITLMVSRKIEKEGICWPIDIAMNDRAEFVGYIMPKAQGKTVQTTMFIKPVLEKSFPAWGRKDLVNLCAAFLDHVRYLHSLNIIVGDINPLNLLVTNDSHKIWMVDTDSFQIEDFPCPVGTVNFTAPEVQGVNYIEYLRTMEHELFAVATMMFMLLHPGKPPYSQQGGGSPRDNIRAMDFPYLFRKNDDMFGGKNTPHGPWQTIWSNLPYHVKEAFHNTFRENRRVSVDGWIQIMRKYQYMLDKQQVSGELFPTSFKIRDPIDASCGKCGKTYTESQSRVEKMALQDKQTWCPECAAQFKLERLARESAKANSQAMRQNTGKSQHSGGYIPALKRKPVQSGGPSSSHQPTQRPRGNGGVGQALAAFFFKILG